MSFVSDETYLSDEEYVPKSDKRLSFVDALKGNSVVLNRSLSAKLVLDKEKAWADIRVKYEKSVGKKTTLEQLKKMLNNMKTEIKKKTDKNQTGNRKIKLQMWEKDFLNILDQYEKPVIMKIPGAASVGIQSKSDDGSSGVCISLTNNTQYTEPEKEVTTQTAHAPEDLRKSLKRKTKDTDETCKLSTGELQRLVLNEQLLLIRLQMQREEIKMKREQIKLKREELEAKQSGHTDQNSDDVTEFDISNLITFH